MFTSDYMDLYTQDTFVWTETHQKETHGVRNSNNYRGAQSTPTQATQKTSLPRQHKMILQIAWLRCSCEAAFPTLGLSWAQLRRQMPPHRTKLRMLSPTCAQTCPSCAMLDPSWAQVGPKLEPTGPSSGPSWAQVSSCLARLKAKDGQVCPQSALGWA